MRDVCRLLGAAGGLVSRRSSISACGSCRTSPTSRARRRTRSSAAPASGCCGKKPKEYKGVAKFFTYLSSPEVQADWHQDTGYVPITLAAYELTKKEGFYEKNPGPDVAVEQLMLKKPTAIRTACASATSCRSATSWTRRWKRCGRSKTPKQALDEAVERGNVVRQFEQANKAGAERRSARSLKNGPARGVRRAAWKSAHLPGGWLPYLLLAPQLAMTLVFFFWPAAQALWQSLLVQDAFGLCTEFVWFDNFRELLHDPTYLESIEVTSVFSAPGGVPGPRALAAAGGDGATM